MFHLLYIYHHILCLIVFRQVSVGYSRFSMMYNKHTGKPRKHFPTGTLLQSVTTTLRSVPIGRQTNGRSPSVIDTGGHRGASGESDVTCLPANHLLETGLFESDLSYFGHFVIYFPVFSSYHIFCFLPSTPYAEVVAGQKHSGNVWHLWARI